MMVTIFPFQYLIRVNSPGGAKLRHGGEHMNVSAGSGFILFFFKHQKLIFLQIFIDDLHGHPLIQRLSFGMEAAVEVCRAAVGVVVGKEDILLFHRLAAAIQRDTLAVLGKIVGSFL